MKNEEASHKNVLPLKSYQTDATDLAVHLKHTPLR